MDNVYVSSCRWGVEFLMSFNFDAEKLEEDDTVISVECERASRWAFRC